MVLMNNTRQSDYPNDVKTLQMKITFETQFRVHVKVILEFREHISNHGAQMPIFSRFFFKIIDHDNMRYEPPYPEVPLVGGIIRDEYDYDVQIDNTTFGFAIIRKDNGKVMYVRSLL